MNFSSFSSLTLFATTETLVAADYVGIVSGRKEPEKLVKAGWTAEKAPNVNAPLFRELPMTLECRVKQKLDEKNMPEDVVKAFYNGDASHDMYIGEVVDIIR